MYNMDLNSAPQTAPLQALPVPRSAYLAQALQEMGQQPASPSPAPTGGLSDLADALKEYGKQQRDKTYTLNSGTNQSVAVTNAMAAARGMRPVIGSADHPWSPLPTSDAEQPSILEGLFHLGRSRLGRSSATATAQY